MATTTHYKTERNATNRVERDGRDKYQKFSAAVKAFRNNAGEESFTMILNDLNELREEIKRAGLERAKNYHRQSGRAKYPTK